jgi:hypothetical protein
MTASKWRLIPTFTVILRGSELPEADVLVNQSPWQLGTIAAAPIRPPLIKDFRLETAD